MWAVRHQRRAVTSGNYFSVIDQDISNETALIDRRSFLSADAKSHICSDANPALTGQVAGLRNGETLERDQRHAFVRDERVRGNDVGSYAIGRRACRYKLELPGHRDRRSSNATALTISRAQLCYLANSVTRIYGDANPALAEIARLKNGEQFGDISEGARIHDVGQRDDKRRQPRHQQLRLGNIDGNYMPTILRIQAT
jgi:hypothetical protein